MYLFIWFSVIPFAVPLSFLCNRRLHFPSCTSQGGEGFLVKMAAPLTLLLILAVTVRAVLYRSGLADLISERVEVVSPLTAWKRGKRPSEAFRPQFTRWNAAPGASSARRCLPVIGWSRSRRTGLATETRFCSPSVPRYWGGQSSGSGVHVAEDLK